MRDDNLPPGLSPQMLDHELGDEIPEKEFDDTEEDDDFDNEI